MPKKLKVQLNISKDELRRKLDIKDGKDGSNGENGKDAVVDTESIALEASKLAQEAIKPLIPDIVPLEEQGAKIVNIIDSRPVGEKVKIDSIEDLRAELEEAKRTGAEHTIISANRNLYQLLDVNVSGITANQSIKWNGTQWVAYTPTTFVSPLTTKGDIYGFSTVDARIPVGADGRPLTANSANATGVGYTGNVNIGTDVYIGHALRSDASDGVIIQSANATDVGILGAGNTANVTWYGNHNFNTATQDTIAGFTGTGKTLGSLSTATYPSLTELSYVKGVTSAIQTQLSTKLDGTLTATRIPFALDSNTLEDEAAFIYTKATNTVTVGGGTDFNIYSVAPNPASYRTDTAYALGYRVTIVNDVIVTRLGRKYQLSDSQNHAARIYSSTYTTRALASGTILASSSTDANGYKWVSITPVLLKAGQSYFIALDENASGDPWANEWTPTIQSDFTTLYSAYGTYGGCPNIYSANTMFTVAAIDYHYPTIDVGQTGIDSDESITIGNPNETIVSTVPYTTDPAIARMNFYAKTGASSWPTNNEKWFSWSADVNGTKTEIMKLYAADATTYGLQGSFFIAPALIKSSTGSGGKIDIQYAYLRFAQAGNDTWMDITKVDTNSGLNLKTAMSNGSTAWGYNFDTTNTFSTSGAVIARFKTGGTIKAYIDKDGGFNGLGIITNRLTTKQQQWEYDGSNYANITVGSTGSTTFALTGTSPIFTFSQATTFSAGITLSTQNIVTDTTTGTKIGTATNQKLGFWNATPNVQPTTAVTAASFVANTSGIVDDSATFGGYTIGQIVAALKQAGLLA